MQGTIRAIPRKISVHKGHHLLTPETRLCASEEVADVVRKALERADLPLAEVDRPGDGVITFAIGGEEALAPFGYTLKITETTVLAHASSHDGLLRAAETLRLLMHAQTGAFGRFPGWQLPCVEIADYGR
ncbi:MAG TPA: glycoside hydrolase family 20 zincin-like fold domain-containing protein [Candidatus Limnocylindrales bacterium]|nr:glycoside hydrolase family 20 zincin-like fold domain-containing protein [Candidatus Limnocylindrales bacterium]